MNGYELLPGFEHVYLEDSWVLQITRHADSLNFTVDLVLNESHELFTPPRPEEAHCYQRALIIFDQLRSLNWTAGRSRAAIDATGDADLGSFDLFRFDGDHYEVRGDFGTLLIDAAVPIISNLARIEGDHTHRRSGCCRASSGACDLLRNACGGRRCYGGFACEPRRPCRPVPMRAQSKFRGVRVNDQAWGAPTQPGYPMGQPVGYPVPPRMFPQVAPGTESRTIGVWLLIAVSALGVVPSIWVTFEMTNVMLTGVQASSSGVEHATLDPAVFAGLFQWIALSVVLGWGSLAFAAWFAALDARELAQRGFVRPFHWAWCILSPLVYVIGRHVVIRRRGGSGPAPLVAMIVSQAVILIGGNLLVMSMMAQFFAELAGTYPRG